MLLSENLDTRRATLEHNWAEAISKVSNGTSQFKILVYLSFRGSSKPSEIAEGIGMPPGTVRPALRSLLEAALVQQSEDGSYSTGIRFTDIISDLYRRLL